MKKVLIYTLVFIAIQVLLPFLIHEILDVFKVDYTSAGAKMLIIDMTAASVAVIVLFLYLRWAVVSRSYIQSRPWDVFFWCGLAALGAIIPCRR